MDEDTVFGIFVVIFLLSIVTLPFTITGCIALSNTRKWAKERRLGTSGFPRTSNDAEPASPLNVSDSASDSESDYLDSEDESFARSRREQRRIERLDREADQALTPTAKFCKEWKKCWRGAGPEQKLKMEREIKEQDERRKIAREAVREYLRIERRKERRARKGRKQEHEGSMELPSYGKVVAEGKQ